MLNAQLSPVLEPPVAIASHAPLDEEQLAPIAPSHPIVTVRELRKVFPKKSKHAGPFWKRLLPSRPATKELFVAVDSVSFAINEGEIFGLLGPNGAGKTTTIKMLSTLLEPTAGIAEINGYNITPQANQVRQSLGAVLTGERSIYWKLTGRENLQYFAAMYHVPPAVAAERIQYLLDRLELASRADEYVEKYSTGMKQRIAIAKALLANPPVVLLDEPTTGLDPQSARNLRELILDIKAEGRTVLLTTHYMEEADQLCDRIGIIDQGRIIALDTPANLKKAIKQLDLLHFEVEGYRYDDAARVWSLTLHTDNSRAVLPNVIELISRRSGTIRHMQIAQPTLEDVFISLTGKQLRE